MERKLYYVTLSGEIHEELDDNDANYDFEVIATEEEMEDLQSLLTKKDDQDFVTFVQANLPYRTKERMKENREYDADVDHIYGMIYRLGSEQTKSRMKESGLI